MSHMRQAETDRNKDEPLLSIVIVSWNTRDVLRNCLRSILTYTRPLEFEIIVVDNASVDGSVGMVNTLFPCVKVMRNEANIGFARACNQGMHASRGQLILLLNSDTFVRDDVIARVARHILSRPDITMIGCQLRYPDGRIQHSAFRSLSIWRSLFEDLWLYRFVSRTRRDNLLLGGYWDNGTEKEVDWIAGAFMMLRRQVFMEMGGFSEDFFMYGEDSEWCMRLRRAGRRILYAPLGVVYHIGSVSSDQEWTQKERMRLCHLGGLHAYSKVNGRVFGFLYHLIRLLGASVRLAVYIILAALTHDSYYSIQRRLYGGQVELYAAALVTHRANVGQKLLARK